MMEVAAEQKPNRRAVQWTGDNREAVERFLGSPDGVEKVMEHPVTGAKTIYVWSSQGLKAAPEGDFLLLADDRLEVVSAEDVQFMAGVEIVE